MKPTLLIHKPGLEIQLASFRFSSGHKSKRAEEKTAALELLSFAGRNGLNYHESGKPFLHGNEESVSFSHSGNLIACALSRKPTVGTDLEKRSDKAFRVAKKFLDPTELSRLNHYDDYTLAWSLKESSYKWLGKKGISIRANFRIEEIDFQNRKACISIQDTSESVHAEWMVLPKHILTWTV